MNNVNGKTTIKAFSFYCTYIDAIGYDAQRELLEVRLNNNRKVKRYVNVPEEIWYQFRESADPDIYYRRYICGRFPESNGNARCEASGKYSRGKSFRR